MKKFRLLLWSALPLLGFGCSTPALPSSSPDQIPVALAEGRPHGLSSAAHMAYWVWRDLDGVWHLRTTTQRVRHGFTGIIHPLPGTSIVDLSPVSPKRYDELSMHDGDVNFDFHPHLDVDGIDFRLTGPGAIELALQIDGDYDPTHVFVGESQQQPSSSHFVLAP